MRNVTSQHSDAAEQPAAPAVRLRAYRVCLDPTDAQLVALAQHAGAQRWAFNYALGRKVEAHRRLAAARQALAVERGLDSADRDVLRGLTGEAVKLVSRIPSAIDNLAVWRAACKTDSDMTPWRGEVSSYCFSSGMRAADVAFKNWLDSLAGRRKGARVGYPRFKSKHRARASFTIYHDVKKPTIRIDDARHLRVPVLGSIRLHSNLRRLIRLGRRGDVTVRSVTIAREGRRWFASILVQEPAPVAGLTRAQVRAGVVGVDVGVTHALVTSDEQELVNDRLGRQVAARLRKAQRALARTQRGSVGRRKAARRVGDLQARLAERRSQRLHQVSKHLVTTYAAIAIEDLNVAGMTRSARGTTEHPGNQVRQKAGLNREILDVAFGELARQLAYKAAWKGVQLVEVGRFEPTSKTCSACGAVRPSLSLADRAFRCEVCGLTLHRDLNAAINIAQMGSKILSAAPDAARLQVARSKPPRPGRVLTGLPDICDKRIPEASYRDARGPISGHRPAGRIDPGRPPPPGGGHPARAIRQRSTHAQKT